MVWGIQSFLRSHRGIALRNDGSDRGQVARYVYRMRSNFSIGLS